MLGGDALELEIAILQHPEIRPRLPGFVGNRFCGVARSRTVLAPSGASLAKIHRPQRSPCAGAVCLSPPPLAGGEGND